MAEPNDTLATATPIEPETNFYLERNVVLSDAVSSTDRDDYYQFYTLYGPSTLYASLLGLSADADLYLLDQDGIQVAASSNVGTSSELINTQLQGNRYYYLRVRSFSGGSTSYSLYLYNDYAGPTLATARDIGVSWGQTSDQYLAYNKINWEDYLDYRDNMDVVKFVMEAPGTISLRMKDFTYTGNLRASMELLDSDGTPLKMVAGTVGDGLNVDRYSLPAGTYYVRYSQTPGLDPPNSDPYTLRIVSDYAGDTTATARDLGSLSGTSRRLYDMVGKDFGLPTYDDPTDLYTFTLDRRSPIDLSLLIDATAFPSPTFDANLRLARDTDGNGFISATEALLSSSDLGSDRLSTILDPGTYYVQVLANGAYTSYQLDLDSDFDAVSGIPRPYNEMSKARPFGSLNGETGLSDGFGVSAGDFSDFFSFTMASAGKLLATAFVNPYYSRDRNDPSLSIVQDANANQQLDPGETITPFGDGSLTAELAAGRYFLHAAGSGEQAAYQLRLVPDFAGDSLSTARAFAPIRGSEPRQQRYRDYIEQAFDSESDSKDIYRFDLPIAYDVKLATSGVAGEDLSLALIQDVNANGTIDPGDVLADSDTSDSPAEKVAASLKPGRYFVQVEGVNGGTNYTLQANFVDASLDPDDTISEVGAIADHTKTPGQSVAFNLGRATDVDLVRFTVEAGQKLGFDVDSRNGSDLDTYLRLFKADGSQLAANDNGTAPGEQRSRFSYLPYRFSEAGTYYAGVSLRPNSAYDPLSGTGDASGAGQGGSYRLTLLDQGRIDPPRVLIGDAGDNGLVGGSRNDSLNGGDGNDTLIGGAGMDSLIGGIGDDLLIGGPGPDQMVGDDGADRFRYGSLRDRQDVIYLFSGAGGDRLEFAAAGFGAGLLPGSLPADRLLAGDGVRAATTPSQRFLYDTTDGSLFFDADGSGTGSAPVQLLTLALPSVGNPAPDLRSAFIAIV